MIAKFHIPENKQLGRIFSTFYTETQVDPVQNNIGWILLNLRKWLLIKQIEYQKMVKGKNIVRFGVAN